MEFILKPAFFKICLANTRKGDGFLSCLFPCCCTKVDKSHEEDMALCAVDMQGDKCGSPSFGGHLDLFGVERYSLCYLTEDVDREFRLAACYR